jgi:hypothetical protein
MVVWNLAVMVDSPPFDRGPLRQSQFSTPVEKPVEIEGFQRSFHVSY